MRERRTSIEMGKQQQQQSLRSSPQHMLTNSILIQTDDGRKYDSSIQYNRIIDNDQYTRHHHKSTRPVFGLLVVSVFVILIMSEQLGFSSFPLVITDSKYNYVRGSSKTNIGNSYNYSISSDSIDDGSIAEDSSSSDIIDEFALADDDLDDELIANDDDEEIQQDVSRDNEEDEIDMVDNSKMKIQTEKDDVTDKGDYIDLKDTDTDIIDEVVKATNQPIVVLKKVANNTMNEFQEVAANIVNELIAEEGLDNLDIGVHKTNVTGESSSKQNISDSVSYNITLKIGEDVQSEGSYDISTRVYTGADDYQRTDINEDESSEYEDNIDDENNDSKDENNQYQKVESMSIVDHRSQHEPTNESVDNRPATQVKVTDQHDNYRYAAAPNYDDDNT